MLTVLGRATSINVRKVLWAADELGLAYNRDVSGLHRDLNAPDFLALNPNAQVPVICDDGFVLWESHAIIRYLAEKHAPGVLLPAEPRARAITEQWLGWQATDLNMAWRYAMMALVRKLPAYGDAARIAESLEAWTAKMRILDARLEETQAYAAGENFTLADVALGLSVHRWFGGDFARPSLPAIDAYYARVSGRAAAQRHFAAATP